MKVESPAKEKFPAVGRGQKPSSESVTLLLQKWRAGDSEAFEKIVPLVDHELRRIAGRLLRRERPDHTLRQTTALVNETYLCLLQENGLDLESRAHFIALTARIMRRILVDHARRHHALKRGGGRKVDSPAEDVAAPPSSSDLEAVDLIAIHRALDELATLDARQARVVELRFFGGLSIEETATALCLSADTVKRDWRNARLWLRRELAGGKA